MSRNIGVKTVNGVRVITFKSKIRFFLDHGVFGGYSLTSVRTGKKKHFWTEKRAFIHIREELGIK